MKISTKINLMTTAWMLVILIIINAVVFFLFIKTTSNMEESALFQKAYDILGDMTAGDTPQTINENLKLNLGNHSFIRIVLPNGKTAEQVTNDSGLSKAIKPKYAKKKTSDWELITVHNQQKQVLIVHVPINIGYPVKGTLEIGERLTGLEMRKNNLLWIMGICTALAAVFSILGGRWLSNIIMRPISNMINTMEDIERSGVLQKINIKHKTNDEIETLARTFNRMIDRIQENMERQKQFISDASHELKTPLTVIKSYANLLRRHGMKDKDMAGEAIQAIHSEATRIQKMTERLLDLAALDKESVLELSEVDLVSLCQSILKQLKDAYRREIQLHYHDYPINIQADELKLKQVIIILLDNAIKYSNDKIEVFLKKTDQYAVILVKDHGIGIPEEEIANIFERFYRVDKARSRETGGSGLGLYIAKRIMKLHKGEIQIRSKEGAGTEVKLLLPIKMETR